MAHCTNCGLDMGHSSLGGWCLTCSNKHYLPEKELTEYDYFKKELLEHCEQMIENARAFEEIHPKESEFWRGLRMANQQVIEWVEWWKA